MIRMMLLSVALAFLSPGLATAQYAKQKAEVQREKRRLDLAAPLVTRSQVPKTGGYQSPAKLNDGWATADAQSQGVDRAALAKLTATIQEWPELGVHAILIERHGKLVYESYFDGFDERWGTSLGRVSMTANSLHDLRSVTKSVISALSGIALSEGAIKSLDQPVVEWFPEFPELNNSDRRRVTLAQVLSMTSGLKWNEDVPYTNPQNDEIRMTRDAQPLRYALSVPFAIEPGKDFTYNGGLTQVMAAVIERATKTPIEDYARTKLFEPLAIKEVEWVGDLAGMPSAASGLRLHPRDLAKFGSLYLHSGRWNGKQVVPEEWVKRSTRRQFRFSPRTGKDAGGEFGYGYYWWYNCYPTATGLIEAPTAVGNGQQRVFVLPGLDMVVTILAGRYNDFTSGATLGSRILREHILPAVRTGIRPGCPNS
ncbi:MAG TPA: serine hydrolase [Pyrinomonadaceae bacterium]|nr:serine hydrolase [Pyrinomonadaceae bacterium]